MADNTSTGLELLRKLDGYFSLWGEVAVLGSKGTKNKRQIILYLGVLAGALSKVVYDGIKDSGNIDFPNFILAFIASFVTFPAIYSSAGLNIGSLTFGKWCIAFQYGFFFESVLNEITELKAAE